MIKYYWLFGVEYFKICKMFDLDGQIMLISFNEAPPIVENFDFEDEGEYFKALLKDYIGSEEISEEKYNTLKKFLNL
jgi:hypothetical protein